jgi:flagellar biosynthetic protein FliR
MNLELGNLYALLLQVILPMLRIGAFMLASPIFTVDAINLRFRISITLVLTLFVVNYSSIPEIDIFSTVGIATAFHEIFTGFVLGFVLQIVSAALTFAGAFVSNSTGLSFANIIDPSMGNIPVIGQFFTLIATLIFLSMDGHLLLLQVLLQSFDLIPVSNYPDLSVWFGIVIQWTASMFLAGVIIGLPVVVSLLIVNSGLIVVTRAAPTMNIFAIGFTALIFSGIFFLYLYFEGITYSIQNLWNNGVQVLNNLMS